MLLSHDLLRRSYSHHLNINNIDDYIVSNILSGHNGFYFPSNETSGSTAFDKFDNLDGSYGTSINLAAIQFAGDNAVEFTSNIDANSRINLEFVGLETVFNPNLGSLFGSIYLTSANWSSATVMTVIIIGVDTNNYFIIFKPATANTLLFRSRIGGVQTDVSVTVPTSAHDAWLSYVATWDSNDELNIYLRTTSNNGTFPAGTWTSNDLTQLWSRMGVNALAGGIVGFAGKTGYVDFAMSASEVTNFHDILKSQENMA